MKGTSTVKSIQRDGETLLVEVEDSIFYPGGGGQPCDTGIIENDSFLGNVEKADKKALYVKPVQGMLHVGEKVVMAVDEGRRNNLVRAHTGEHILFKSLEMALGDIELHKITLRDGEDSSLYIKTKNITWKDIFKAEEIANKIIEEDREIIEKIYTREEAIALKKLRIKPERIKSDSIRVVEVKDFDWSACTGTHAASTGFVGQIFVTSFGITKGKWELKFSTDKDVLFRLARASRESASELNTNTDDLKSRIISLQEETESFKEKYRESAAKLLDHYKEEKIGNIRFICNIVEGVEKKQLTDKAGDLMDKDTVICFASILDNTLVMISAHPELGIDAPQLIKDSGARGGGRGSFAMGSVDDPQRWISSVRSLIEKISP